MNIDELSRIVAHNKIRELKERHEAMTPETRDQEAQVILSNCNSMILLAVSSESK